MSNVSLNLSLTISPLLRDVKGRFASLLDGAAMDSVRQRLSLSSYRALQIAQNAAPKNTGKFAGGLSLVNYGENGFAIVSDNPDLLNWLRSGTGVYAGHGRIFPINGRAMVFNDWRQAIMAPNYRGAWAFSSIAGMAANPWEQSALADISSILEEDLPKVALDWVAALGIGEVE